MKIMKNDSEDKKMITFTEREASYVLAALVVGLFLVFAAGYFVGKRRVCDELTLRDDVRFSERVHSALSNLRGLEGSDEDADDVGEPDAKALKPEVASEERKSLSSEKKSAGQVGPLTRDSAAASSTSAKAEKTENVVVGDAKPGAKACATLCGFAAEDAARAYVERLTKRGIKAHVVERTSVSGKGVKKSWYQVVTDPYEMTALQTLVKQLRRVDKLSRIEVTNCP